jgi:plastocyanin
MPPMRPIPVISGRLSRRPTAGLAVSGAVLSVAVALAACSGGPAGTPESFDPNSPQITAQGLKFDSTQLQVPANQGFALVLFNRDSTSHNVSIYSDAGHAQRVFGGSLAGNGTTVYHVQALAPGTYYFECDVHPDMKGTLVAS